MNDCVRSKAPKFNKGGVADVWPECCQGCKHGGKHGPQCNLRHEQETGNSTIADADDAPKSKNRKKKSYAASLSL